jgi:FkbM family methyltransferase
VRSKVLKFLKNIFANFGIQIARRDYSKEKIFPNDLELDLLFDVGANVGQYVYLVRSQGFNKRIVSFEPIAEAHERLTFLNSGDKDWRIFERCAIGSKNGFTTINISQNSYSSSLLPMLKAHVDAAPDSKYIGTESVPIYRLADVWRNYFSEYQKLGVKIDVQGFEMEVLYGLKEILDLIHFVQIEMSLIHVYENQKLYFEIDEYLRTAGFMLWKTIPGFTHAVNGQQFQFDGIYIK